MADYFTNFSLILHLDQTAKEYALALDAIAQAHGLEDPLPEFPEDLIEHLDTWTFETEPEKDGIWLHSETNGVDAVCAFIQHLLKKFELKDSIQFEWSFDCSKPLTDAYGGGAALITAQEIKSFTTSSWLDSVTNKHSTL